MVFNDTTATQNSLVHDINFLLGGITNSEFALADKARSVNERYRTIWSWVFEAYGGWIFVDDNTSDTSTFPRADVSLTDGTKAYGLPSGSLTVRGVEVEDSNGVATVLKPTTYEEIQELSGAVTEFMITNAIPTHYVVTGDVIELYPTPNYTRTNAMRVYFDRDISTFTGSSTTTAPGFAAPFHRALSVGAALDYAMANGMAEKITVFQGMWLDFERRIKKFYQERYYAKFPPRVKVKDLLMEFA